MVQDIGLPFNPTNAGGSLLIHFRSAEQKSKEFRKSCELELFYAIRGCVIQRISNPRNVLINNAVISRDGSVVKEISIMMDLTHVYRHNIRIIYHTSEIQSFRVQYK